MQATTPPIASVSPPAVERYAVLALRRDIALGVLLSTHAGDFLVVLAAAAQSFPAGHEFNEPEVNALLRDFLAGAGSMLATDHVELRRWLVDFRVLARDGYGRVYTAGSPSAELSTFIDQFAGVDLASVARTARERDAAQRAQRRSRWEAAKRESRG